MGTVGQRPTAATRPTAAQPPPRGEPRWLMPVLVVLAFVVVGWPLADAGGRLSEVQRNDSAAYLPRGAEATRVAAAARRFTGMDTTTAVIVYTRPAGITETDGKQLIPAALAIADRFDTRLASPPRGPLVADDGQAAQITVQFAGSDPVQFAPDVAWLRQQPPPGPGWEVHVAGPAAVLTDLTEVFTAVDGVLLAVTGALILLILIVVYRSPILPLLVLGVAGTALGIAEGIIYLLARNGVLTVSGDAQGILSVLVLGAGTDYALLLVARYREELRRHADRYVALRTAWRACVPPVLACGGTVIAALLCLTVSDLAAIRGLGPVAAIGIACALVSMLALLPAVLALAGGVVFWPSSWRRSAPARTGGRSAAVVGRRPRLVWTVTALVLGILAVGMVRLTASGVPRGESFRVPVDSNAGQALLTEHFPQSPGGSTAVVITRAAHRDAVFAAVAALPGVARAVAYTDPQAQIDSRLRGTPPPPPMVVDGLVRIDAVLSVPADSLRARIVVRELRAAVRAVPGADAIVGGYTAGNLDVQDTARRDRLLIIPLVLVLVFAILALLLRALVAALVLTATVVVSFLATLGVSGVVFTDLLGYAGADASFPLYTFVFLVALGVDYTVFLMARIREERAGRDHRDATLTALAVTGGVITSAGLVLAATFAALAVLPLVVLAELAFAVSFGVLLDTFVVRTLLVPALTLDLGTRMWWPARARPAPAPAVPPAGRGAA